MEWGLILANRDPALGKSNHKRIYYEKMLVFLWPWGIDFEGDSLWQYFNSDLDVFAVRFIYIALLWQKLSVKIEYGWTGHAVNGYDLVEKGYKKWALGHYKNFWRSGYSCSNFSDIFLPLKKFIISDLIISVL